MLSLTGALQEKEVHHFSGGVIKIPASEIKAFVCSRLERSVDIAEVCSKSVQRSDPALAGTLQLLTAMLTEALEVMH